MGGRTCTTTCHTLRDSKQNQIRRPTRPIDVDAFEEKLCFGTSRKKSELGLGSAIFGISEVDVLP